MKIVLIVLVGLFVLFAAGFYSLGENLPSVLSKMQPFMRNIPSVSSTNTSQEEPSEPLVETKAEYYEIYGETAEQVATIMDIVSPVWIVGKQHRASTHSPIRWRFSFKKSEGSCAIDKVQAKVWIKYTYPKWKNYRAALPELQEKWDTFMKSLVRHEEGHGDISIEAAREIQRAILELEPRSTCEELEYEANETGQEIIWEFDKKQKEFDEDERNHYYERGLAFP